LYGKRSTPPLDPADWWRGVILDTFRNAGVAEQRTSTFFSNRKGCRYRLTRGHLAGLAPISDELSNSLVRRFWGSEGYELHAEVDSFLQRLHALPYPPRDNSVTGSSSSQRFPPPVVVSNTDPAVLKILDSLGVTDSTFAPRAAGIRHDQIFTTWLLEEDKKDVRFWEEVLRRLRSETGGEGLDPGEVLVVGDELVS
jgi:FMN phosphatase YigB (HAD superfamily)